jgi:hypothetical protein
MENTTKTEAAQTAVAVRAALKVAFPGTKFSVRSENFSGGDAVRIGWTDGPATDAVDAVTGRFASGTFNGMTDSYEYDRDRKGPTAMFVTCTRETSEALRLKCETELRAMFASEPREGFETLAYRILRKADLRTGYAGLRAVDGFPGFEVVPVSASEVA